MMLIPSSIFKISQIADTIFFQGSQQELIRLERHEGKPFAVALSPSRLVYTTWEEPKGVKYLGIENAHSRSDFGISIPKAEWDRVHQQLARQKRKQCFFVQLNEEVRNNQVSIEVPQINGQDLVLVSINPGNFPIWRGAIPQYELIQSQSTSQQPQAAQLFFDSDQFMGLLRVLKEVTGSKKTSITLPLQNGPILLEVHGDTGIVASGLVLPLVDRNSIPQGSSTGPSQKAPADEEWDDDWNEEV